MADYLPDMIAPPPQPEAPPMNDHIPDNIDEAIREEPQSEDDELLPEDEEEEPIQIVPTKEKLDMDDVFSTPKVKAVKRTREEMLDEKRKIRELVKQQKIEEKERLKQEKILERERKKAEAKAARPKKKLSPEHLAKLQAARAKSVAEKRKQKSLEKDIQPKKSPPAQEQLFTKDDLIKSQYEAIQLYDQKRKKEKAEKKAAQEEQRKLALNTQTIRRAVGQPDPNDIWSHALNGMFQ